MYNTSLLCTGGYFLHGYDTSLKDFIDPAGKWEKLLISNKYEHYLHRNVRIPPLISVTKVSERRHTIAKLARVYRGGVGSTFSAGSMLSMQLSNLMHNLRTLLLTKFKVEDWDRVLKGIDKVSRDMYWDGEKINVSNEDFLFMMPFFLRHTSTHETMKTLIALNLAWRVMYEGYNLSGFTPTGYEITELLLACGGSDSRTVIQYIDPETGLTESKVPSKRLENELEEKGIEYVKIAGRNKLKELLIVPEVYDFVDVDEEDPMLYNPFTKTSLSYKRLFGDDNDVSSTFRMMLNGAVEELILASSKCRMIMLMRSDVVMPDFNYSHDRSDEDKVLVKENIKALTGYALRMLGKGDLGNDLDSIEDKGEHTAPVLLLKDLMDSNPELRYLIRTELVTDPIMSDILDKALPVMTSVYSYKVSQDIL